MSEQLPLDGMPSAQIAAEPGALSPARGASEATGRASAASERGRSTPRLLEENRDENWSKRAACAGKGDLFFPDHAPLVWPSARPNPDYARATVEPKEICRTCPVLEACRTYALSVKETRLQHGVWGGMDFFDRRRARKVNRD